MSTVHWLALHSLPRLGGVTARRLLARFGSVEGVFTAPDEALLIEFHPPECDYWNFQLNNYWLESLEHRDHRIDLNHAAARPEADDRIRLVVAHRDPGHPNWIDTAHHARGTMGLRIVKGRTRPIVEHRVVGLADVPPYTGGERTTL